ncbi:MAG TPA: PAS domain S-box protein [Spirochaetota bacterium]|nr:PAS domain S-box protein [Spirochaetota bacterium]
MKILRSYRVITASSVYAVCGIIFFITLHFTSDTMIASTAVIVPAISGSMMLRRCGFILTTVFIFLFLLIQILILSFPISAGAVIIYSAALISSAVLSYQAEILRKTRNAVANSMREQELLRDELSREKEFRKSFESLLHEREGLYQNLVETIPHGIGVLDMRGVITFANHASHHIFGYEYGEMAGEMIFNLLVAKSDRIEMHDFIMNLLNGTKEPVSYLYKFRTKDGRIIDVQIDWNYNHDRAGAIIGLIAVFTDVTRRIEAEKILEIQKTELRKRLRETNCLYSISYILGNSEPLSDDTCSRVVEILRNSFSSPESTVVSMRIEGRQFITADFVFREPHIHSDIHVHDLRVGIIDICYIGPPMQYNEDPFLPEEHKMLHETAYQVGNALEKKKTETALRESETLLQAIFNVSTETIAMISPDGKIVDINDIGARRFRETKENLVGAMLYKYLPKETRRSRLYQINEVLKTGTPVRFQDKQYERTFDINILPVFHGNGQLQYIAIFASDISPIMRLQETITTISERERQQLGQDLHDDLGQHLTGISYMITVLRQKLQDNGYSEAEDAAQISRQIKSAIERLRKLSRGLCPISIEKDGFIDALKEMCAGVEEIYAIPCRFHVRGDIDIPDSLKAINLFYIAQESVNNALKHAHPGLIDITVSHEDSLISMTIRNDYGVMVDTITGKKGIGIEVMKYRANLIGGSVEIIEEDSQFTVAVRLPI